MSFALLALRWTYQNVITVVVWQFILWFAFVFLVICFFPSASFGRSGFALVVHGEILLWGCDVWLWRGGAGRKSYLRVDVFIDLTS